MQQQLQASNLQLAKSNLEQEEVLAELRNQIAIIRCCGCPAGWPCSGSLHLITTVHEVLWDPAIYLAACQTLLHWAMWDAVGLAPVPPPGIWCLSASWGRHHRGSQVSRICL